jgi:type IX secretion system PorP/SprF family membrane protein
MMKTKIMLLLLLVAGYSGTAQQDAMFTHYMFNTSVVNPAYAGSRNALTVTALHRAMWVGFDGAPETQTLTLHTPLFSERFGAGFSVLNDKIGPTRSTKLSTDIATNVKVGKTAKLAFGLKGSFFLRTANFSQLKLNEQADNTFANNADNLNGYNMSAGLYYYTNIFYIGMSSTRMLENQFDTKRIVDLLGESQRHYYTIIGGAIKLSPSVIFKPTGLIKYTRQAPIEGDVTATFLFNDKFWAGAMYRTGDALGVLLGVKITGQLSAGYSFDWSYANTTVRHNSGSHELMLRYDFEYHNKKRIISPRYF